jgi:hypothetical protein
VERSSKNKSGNTFEGISLNGLLMDDKLGLILFEKDGVFGLESDKVLYFLPADHVYDMIFLKETVKASRLQLVRYVMNLLESKAILNGVLTEADDKRINFNSKTD